MFLDCICGSTTGGLGLLGLYINENNVSLINQTLETLTEYCQVRIVPLAILPVLRWLLTMFVSKYTGNMFVCCNNTFRSTGTLPR